MRTVLKAVVLAALVLPTTFAQRLNVDGATQTFSVLSNQYFDEFYFSNAPTLGTSVGYHQYDTQLEDYSASATAKQIAGLHEWQRKIEDIPSDGLDTAVAADREILLNSIRSQLLTLEAIRPFEKNPDIYSSGITSSIFVLMERPFAPVNIRLRDVIARERSIPQVFIEAKKNLQNPPRISTEIAIEQIDGIIHFFQNDVPLALDSSTDRIAKIQFAKTNAAVIAALQDYAAWLKTDLLPRSNGDFRLGTDTYRKKLLYDEMVDTPLDKLLALNEANMHQNQAEFARIAKEIDPNKTPQQMLAELATIHPAPAKLLDAFRDSFNAEIAFIKDHHIITLPSDERPELQETPPFMRATTTASMDPPGAFETQSKKAYFNVTLPEKNWTAEHIAEHMAEFNIGTIVSTSIHEAYPGHFTQFLWQSQFPSRIRKIIGASTNLEGWAHYCEQMMLDEGFQTPGADERTRKLIHLGQLQDALLRNARFTVGIKMHTEGWTTQQAEDYFVKEGYQSPSIAKLETKRGTSDPTYLYYTLGKLEILKLRDDVKAKQGAKFNLQAFHDNFMRQGPVPIEILRQAMLHDTSPVL